MNCASKVSLLLENSLTKLLAAMSLIKMPLSGASRKRYAIPADVLLGGLGAVSFTITLNSECNISFCDNDSWLLIICLLSGALYKNSMMCHTCGTRSLELW